MFSECTEHIEKTKRLCEQDPFAAAIGRKLAAVEEEFDWDAPPTLYQVDRHPQRPEIAVDPTPLLQFMLDRTVERVDGDFGAALCHLATFVEGMTNKLRSGEATDLAPDSYLRRAAEAGRDLLTARTPGYRPHGLAIAATAWAVVAEPDSEVARGEVRVRDAEQRVEMRMVFLAGRDGLSWTVARTRGEQPTTLVHLPESDDQFVGAIGNALSRIVNAGCGNPVPIMPDETGMPGVSPR